MFSRFARIVTSVRQLKQSSILGATLPVSKGIITNLSTKAVNQRLAPAVKATGPFSVDSKRRQSAKISKIRSNDSGNGILVAFNDDSSQEFMHIWLRDSCRCSSCYNTTVQLRHTGSWITDINLKPLSYDLTDDGHLRVQWPGTPGNADQHTSIYDDSWLWDCHKKMMEGLTTVPSVSEQRPGRHLWDKLPELPNIPFIDFMETDDGLRQWMKEFHKFGFAILKGVPDDSTTSVAERISFIRETCYGYTSEVLMGPESGNHPSYTGDPIQLHTDLTYMERSPGTLNLHFIRAADPETAGVHAGGQTILADGIQVAEWLRQHKPEAFQLLTKIRIPYKYTMPSTGFSYTSNWPVITLGPREEVQEIHFSQFARRVLNIQPEIILSVYEALKTFSDRLQDSRVSFYLRSGDLLSINNRRVLHARTSFDPSKAARHLRTFYMDLDEVYGRYDTIMNNNVYPII